MADGNVPSHVWHPSQRDRLVARAALAVLQAVKRGLLPELETQKCADCGVPAECYDHRNYYEPLVVVPVCKGCNNRRGPGFPEVSKEDGGRYKDPVRRSTQGRRGWNWIEGNGAGTSIIEYPVHVELPEEHEEFDRRIYVAIGSTFNDFLAFRRVTGKVFSHSNSGFERCEYFKAHDAWA